MELKTSLHLITGGKEERRAVGIRLSGGERGTHLGGFPEEVTFEMGSEGEKQPTRGELVSGAAGGQRSRSRDQSARRP